MNYQKFVLATVLALSSGMFYTYAAPQDPRVVGVSAQKKTPENMPAFRKGEAGEKSVYECIYEYKINTGMGETYATILQIGDNMTKFTDYSSFRLDSINTLIEKDPDIVMDMITKRMNVAFFFDTEVWQNLPEGSMTVTQEVVPNVMGYREPMGAMEWTLSADSTVIVCGYVCQKATTTYGGREWTVWYTPDIPVSAGPWKFQGLPGLIMAANDSEGIFSFNAITFRSGDTPITLPDKLKTHYSSRDKVLKHKVYVEEKGMNGIDPSMIERIDVAKTLNGKPNIIINGVSMRERSNPYIPLEKQ